MELSNYNDLLYEASEIYKRIPRKEKTFMDISGYPHYENVCSNILAFYFNPLEEHNLNNLVINSFIKVLISKNYNIEVIKENEKLEIEREYTTIKGNRIDIVIQNNDFVIGIENKIDASVYNDLEDYSETLNKLNSNSIKVLLSLYDNSSKIDNSEFINITYQEFFRQLKTDLLNNQDNNKWLIFLKEFIQNLENYEGEVEMEEEVLNWLKDNKEKLEELDKIKEIANKSIERKVNELKSLLENKLAISFIRIWKGNNEMVCYIDSPKKYHIDANLTPAGWKVGLFAWTVGKNNEIQQILRNSNYDLIEDDGSHRILYKYDFNTSLDVIIEKVIEIYEFVENYNLNGGNNGNE